MWKEEVMEQNKSKVNNKLPINLAHKFSLGSRGNSVQLSELQKVVHG